MSARRARLVQMAFDRLDKDGTGIVDAAEVADAYDASRHPDVMAGKRTSNEVLRDFLETFEVGDEVDGAVTQQEFHLYYQRVSASIDSDDYWELMLRNAWHIPGRCSAASGWCS
jgi:Ca2+-binding EF-hand superfamily protein